MLRVTSPDERARDDDRDDAIKVVEAALKSGRIIQADRDKRVDELRQAQTMQDIDIIVRDLRQVPRSQHVSPGQSAATVAAMSVPAAGTTPMAPGQQPWPLVNYGPEKGGAVEVTQLVGKAGAKIGGIIAAVILVSIVVPIAGVAIALFSARDSFPDSFSSPTDDTTYLPGQDPGEGGINVHTESGYQTLVDAVREETGSTEVLNLILYPRYAVIQVPLDGGTGRYQSFYWDGQLAAQSKGTTTYKPFDMTRVRPELMIQLLEQVRGSVEAPTSWYVIATKPPDIAGQIGAYASNEFSESEYVIATFAGEIIYDSTSS